MSKNKTLTVLIVLGVILLFVTACQAEPEVVEVEKVVTQVVEVEKVVTATAEQTAEETSSSGIKRGGTIKIGFLQEVINLDPATFAAMVDFRVMMLSYEGLLIPDPATLEPKPYLAKSWDISPDGLTYTFYLQEGVKWHNGAPFTADDVKFTFDNHIDLENETSWSAYFYSLDSIEVIDDLTVQFNMKNPYSAFLSMLVMIPIQNREWTLESGENLMQTMMGTGPFMVKENIPGQVLRVVKNPDYWRIGEDGQPLPYLDGVDIMPILDGTARTANLLAGEIDMDGRVNLFDVPKLRDNPDITLYGPADLAWSGIWFNNETPPYDNKLVRQAFGYAIDRKEIAEVGLMGLFEPVYGSIVPSWHLLYNEFDTYKERDMEKAKALLAEAGYPDGEGFPEVIVAGAIGETEATITEMVASYLMDLGIDAKAEQMDSGTFFDSVIAGSIPVYYCGFSVPSADPDEYYNLPFRCNGTWNWPRYCNPELDKLLDKGMAESDPDKRRDIYKDLETILLDDLPVAFMLLPSHHEAAHTYVKGFEHVPGGCLYTMGETWLDK